MINNLERIKVFDNCVGVYFLFDDEEVVYVGSSTNLFGRIGYHIEDGKEFDSFSFIQVSHNNLRKKESEYIIKYQPKYNVSVPEYVNIKTLQNRVKDIMGHNVSMKFLREAIFDLNIHSLYFKGYQIYHRNSDEHIAEYMSNKYYSK